MSAQPQAIDYAKVAAQAAVEKKAQAVIALDVSERLVLTDVFVLAAASNERQVRAIVQAVDEAVEKAGLKLLRREGFDQCRWVLLDFGDIVVHVQHEDDREFYALEKLWSDVPQIDLGDIESELADDNASSASPTVVSPEELIAGGK